jgi:hypothetical protein
MGPLLVLSFTFLSNFPVLGMDESSESFENSAPPKKVKSKQALLSRERNKKVLNLMNETVMRELFDELGYQVLFNETLKGHYQKMGIKFILRSQMTRRRLDQERKGALEVAAPGFNEKLSTLWK